MKLHLNLLDNGSSIHPGKKGKSPLTTINGSLCTLFDDNRLGERVRFREREREIEIEKEREGERDRDRER